MTGTHLMTKMENCFIRGKVCCLSHSYQTLHPYLTKCTVSVGGGEGEAGHASPERVPSRGGTFCPVSGQSLEEL